MQYELIQLLTTNSYNTIAQRSFCFWICLPYIAYLKTRLLLTCCLVSWGDGLHCKAFANPPVIFAAPLWKIARFSTSFFNCGHHSWMECSQSSCTNAKHSSKAIPEYRDREYQAGVRKDPRIALDPLATALEWEMTLSQLCIQALNNFPDSCFSAQSIPSGT